MKISPFHLLVVSLEASGIMGTLLRTSNIDVVEIDEYTQMDKENESMSYPEEPGSHFLVTKSCKQAGYRLALDPTEGFAACCPHDQTLLGSKDTVFDCCSADHEITGSLETGYQCCAMGEEWNGIMCKPVPMSMRFMLKNAPEPTCTSGISAGRCYTFTFPNGRRFGFSGTFYSAALEDNTHQYGKFKLCRDMDCSSSGPINPGNGFFLRDVHGKAKTGENSNQWVSRQVNGGKLGKTALYAQAGTFTLSKWAEGKYCLGGAEEGLSFENTHDKTAATFVSYDKEACIPVKLTEIPCNIRARENNCIWENESEDGLGSKSALWNTGGILETF